MISQTIEVVHYVNQFFAGIGGEEKAEHPLEVREGPVGPGRGLQPLLGDRARIVTTIVCGDDFYNSNRLSVRERVIELLANRRPQVFIAGPAFGAGRYGVACGDLCQAVTVELGLPAITAMHPQNPGVELYRATRGLYILPAENLASDMPNVLPRLAALALKLGLGSPPGPADEEGYLPTGYRPVMEVGEIGARRAVNMLLAKLQGRPYATEMPVQSFDSVAPAPPVRCLREATVALLTTSGTVPRGNPDGFRLNIAERWGHYPIAGLTSLDPDDWQLMHGGFNTAFAEADKHLVLPLDAARELEGHAFGRLHPEFVSLTGVGTPVGNARRLGSEIASFLKEAGVDAGLLVST
ncbi:MAG: glycine/betaine/sarcosine/D-proline family reductase selenoprotein B [Chloroflexi bacterium]|nr:glycine/betaine/sarcosine/D-proline family reductase selenoprotein B [Chloroflexota bacterium]